MLDRQVTHLTRLVDDLLDVSRIAIGKITLQREPLEIAQIVTSAVESSQPLIDSREHPSRSGFRTSLCGSKAI